MGALEELRVSSFLAAAALRRGNRGTTIMTVVILAIVFINMLFIPAVFAGLGQMYNERVVDYYSGHVVLYPPEDQQYIENATDVAGKVAGLPGVIGTTRREATGAILSYRSRVLSKPLVAINPVDEATVSKLHLSIADGEFLDEGDEDQILLGNFLAGEKGVTEEVYESLRGASVGETVRITFTNGAVRDYRVKGIVQSKDEMIDNEAFITKRGLDRVLGDGDRATAILIRLAPSVPPDDFKYDLMSLGISQRVKTWLEDAANVQEMLRSFDVINALSSMAAILIGVIVIFVVVYINTVNRRRQIGILKAIGIERSVIVNSYLFQVVGLCLCGIALGTALLLGLVAYLTVVPIAFPNGDLRPYLATGAVVQNAVMLLLASVVAGYIPASMTAKEGILTALRG